MDKFIILEVYNIRFSSEKHSKIEMGPIPSNIQEPS